MQGIERPKTPQATFDRVAPYYDAFNSLLSLGIDRTWRRHAARSLQLSAGARAMELVRAAPGAVAITACDINERMLAVARQRFERARLGVELVHCDALSLPFSAGEFDAATLA